MVGIIVFAAFEMGLIIYAILNFTRLVGTADTRNDLSTTVIPIVGTLAAIIVIHTAIWYFYFQYEPMSMNLYFLISGMMTMLFSLTALSVSLCQRG